MLQRKTVLVATFSLLCSSAALAHQRFVPVMQSVSALAPSQRWNALEYRHHYPKHRGNTHHYYLAMEPPQTSKSKRLLHYFFTFHT